MNLPVRHLQFSGRAVSPLTAAVCAQGTARPTRHAGFTLVEIAICLAIISVALVAIIGVLPIGMRTQRDNREETIINQDATVFLEAVRSGARGLDDLTNYVYAITNFRGIYPGGTLNTYGYTFPNNIFTNIVGFLSTPEYTDVTNGTPIPNLLSGGYSNHIVAYVRSLSGPAVEKPPQDNDIILGDAFGYRILCVNAPVATDTNVFVLPPGQRPYNTQLADSLHELRLTFLWPQLPNGGVGAGRQTFRTLVAGQILQLTNNNQTLYFYQPQSFTNAVNPL
ncbi:MAG: type II secretion system protein [Verrucomicrobiota bacterium]|jgi:prepilin-type N-terminal cleavage/methylation domain-containing protein